MKNNNQYINRYENSVIREGVWFATKIYGYILLLPFFILYFVVVVFLSYNSPENSESINDILYSPLLNLFRGYLYYVFIVLQFLSRFTHFNPGILTAVGVLLYTLLNNVRSEYKDYSHLSDSNKAYTLGYKTISFYIVTIMGGLFFIHFLYGFLLNCGVGENSLGSGSLYREELKWGEIYIKFSKETPVPDSDLLYKKEFIWVFLFFSLFLLINAGIMTKDPYYMSNKVAKNINKLVDLEKKVGYLDDYISGLDFKKLKKEKYFPNIWCKGDRILLLKFPMIYFLVYILLLMLAVALIFILGKWSLNINNYPKLYLLTLQALLIILLPPAIYVILCWLLSKVSSQSKFIYFLLSLTLFMANIPITLVILYTVEKMLSVTGDCIDIIIYWYSIALPPITALSSLVWFVFAIQRLYSDILKNGGDQSNFNFCKLHNFFILWKIWVKVQKLHEEEVFFTNRKWSEWYIQYNLIKRYCRVRVQEDNSLNNRGMRNGLYYLLNKTFL